MTSSSMVILGGGTSVDASYVDDFTDVDHVGQTIEVNKKGIQVNVKNYNPK